MWYMLADKLAIWLDAISYKIHSLLKQLDF